MITVNKLRLLYELHSSGSWHITFPVVILSFWHLWLTREDKIQHISIYNLPVSIAVNYSQTQPPSCNINLGCFYPSSIISIVRSQ